MNRSFVTWRLSFTAAPNNELLQNISSLLEPISSIKSADDAGFIFREYGLSDYIIAEKEAQLSAGEILLNCLVKAHRLGKGWSIGCASKKISADWSDEDWKTAALPESLHELQGQFNADYSFAKSEIPTLQSASFTITVIKEAQVQPQPIPKETAPTAPYRRPSTAETVEFSVYIKPAINKALALHQIYQLSRNLPEIKSQLGTFGYRFVAEGYEEMLFDGPDKTTARVQLDADAVSSIDYILSSYKAPHLLDETEYEKKQNEYEELFHNCVNHVEKTSLGTPVFVGASGDKGFPQDQWADWAALWVTQKYRVLIEVKQNDKEMPIELCLVIAPLDPLPCD
ncbi:hypothetical protein MCHI_003846 [Candidatus Magnetoovum chiemensis]|nr:hypothetical protein MCHI_003846 [Candidatus Magnetoovum chiemensis]